MRRVTAASLGTSRGMVFADLEEADDDNDDDDELRETPVRRCRLRWPSSPRWWRRRSTSTTYVNASVISDWLCEGATRPHRARVLDTVPRVDARLSDRHRRAPHAHERAAALARRSFQRLSAPAVRLPRVISFSTSSTRSARCTATSTTKSRSSNK